MEFSFDAQREYSDQTFKRLKYSGRVMDRKEFEQCTFTGCTFSETTFANCKFRDCTFKECDLRLAKVNGSAFIGTNFEQCKITGVNWTTGSWPKTSLLHSIGFNDCDISASVFIGLDLKKIRIIRCVAKGADFAEANLTQANCTFTDFTDSRFL